MLHFIRQTLKVVKAVESLPGMAPLLEQLQQQLNSLRGLYPSKTGSPQTVELELLDARRDAALAGIRGMMEALTRHYVPEKAAAAKRVLAVFDHFGARLTALNYIAETQVIYGIVQRLTQDADLQAATVLLQADDWVAELDAANRAFNDVFVLRTVRRAGRVKGGLGPGRKMAVAVYHKMALHLQALQVVQPDAALATVIARQNALVKDYRELVRRRKGAGRSNKDGAEGAG